MSPFEVLIALALTYGLGFYLTRGPMPKPARIAVWMIILFGSSALYLNLGRPDLRDQPLSGRDPALLAMAAGEQIQLGFLRQEAANAPDSVAAQQDLARHLMNMGQYAMAANAWREAISRAGDQPDAALVAGLGAALSEANEGIVTEEAKNYFEEALALNPLDHVAASYLGLARLQAGDTQGAYDAWTALLENAPPDAPWAAALKARTETLGMELELEPQPEAP